jgi:chromosome segregation ATPase
MDDHERGIGKGFLQGLKKVLFTPDHLTADARLTSTTPAGKPDGVENARKSAPIEHHQAINGADPAVTQDMKARVYELLDKLNQEGVDFFEVWKAAQEMGGANPTNIRAAYTSLRFADRKLSKKSLLQSGNDYLRALERVIETESAKRLQEKSALEKEREDTRARLDTDIRSLEAEIRALQEKLAVLTDQRQRIDDTFSPRIREIDIKIDAGRQAVDAVMQEMRAVIAIMERDIN